MHVFTHVSVHVYVCVRVCVCVCVRWRVYVCVPVPPWWWWGVDLTVFPHKAINQSMNQSLKQLPSVDKNN